MTCHFIWTPPGPTGDAVGGSLVILVGHSYMCACLVKDVIVTYIMGEPDRITKIRNKVPLEKREAFCFAACADCGFP